MAHQVVPRAGCRWSKTEIARSFSVLFFNCPAGRGEQLGRGVKAQVFRALAELQLGARAYRKSDLPKVRSWLAEHPSDDPDTEIDHWQQLYAAARTLRCLPSIDDAWRSGRWPPAARYFTDVVHQLAPLGEEVAAPIGGLEGVTDRMRQRHLDDVVRMVRCLRRPVAERAAETVRGERIVENLVDRRASPCCSGRSRRSGR